MALIQGLFGLLGVAVWFGLVRFCIFLSHYAVHLFGYQIGVWYVLAGVTLPISFLKQIVSVVQLVVACKNLGALDAVARAKQRAQQHAT